MKILSSNTGYFLGFNGSFLNYILYGRRAIRNNKSAELRKIGEFVDTIEDINPDIIAAQEIDQGSLRTHTSGQVQKISEIMESREMNYKHQADNKYRPSSQASRLPVLKHMSNAVFHKKGETTKHYIGPGNKQLVHETKLNDISVFSVHLPTIRHFRRKQLKNLVKLASKREKTIICGDFNTYRGMKEIKNMLKENDLILNDPGPTNPSHKPSRHLDYFLTSKELDVKRFKTLENSFSDHRPVMIEVDT